MTRNTSIRFAAAIILLFSASVSAFPAFAQSSLPFVSPLFSDNMVLQRGIKDQVWGWTTPGQKITVQFDGKSASGVAGLDGRWSAFIGPFKAGGPYTLTISGPITVTFSNVLVGDVWVCSGQSNMEFGIGSTLNSKQEIANANYPLIRIFTTEKIASPGPLRATTGEWNPVTPDTITSEGTWNGFSAVGYFFGRDLQQDINVPIGLIQSAWGGTPAEAWTAQRELTTALPSYSYAVSQLASYGTPPTDQEKQNWFDKYDPGALGNWQDPTLDTSSWESAQVPGYYQQAGLADLQNMNGIVWYRKTFDLPASDVGLSGQTHLYVDDNDTTWVNGTKLGATEGVSFERTYAIPASLLKPTGNVIVVRDVDTGGNGGVYGDPTALRITFNGGVDIPLAGTWQVKLAANMAKIAAYPGDSFGNPSFPTVLYNGMIFPLEGFGIKGAIWYQGEANERKALEYRTGLPTMITSWRDNWGVGKFPFLIVQLAGYHGAPGTWAEVRYAQWLTAQTLPNTGIATAVDIGDENNIHPENKQEVGRRLALVAERLAYHQKVDDSGPVFKSVTPQGSVIKVTFDDIAGGLVQQGKGPLTGFQVAGADGKFYDADAYIDATDSNVIVSSPSVPNPVAVQYSWSDWSTANLYNSDGLPAFPFKSDEK